MNVTCFVPASPSAVVTLATDSVGAASSSTIVPVAVVDDSVALAAPVRASVNRSASSTVASSVVGTVIVAVVAPAGMVTTALAAVKSAAVAAAATVA